MKDQIPNGLAGYILGIISIIFAFVQPFLGIVLGFIGFFSVRKIKGDFGIKGKKLNLIGVILGVIMFILAIVLASTLSKYCASNPLTPFCQALGGI